MTANPKPASAETEQAEIDFGAAQRLLCSQWRQILVGTVAAAALGAAGSYLIKPTFTAHATFLSPQQQGGASAALAQLGALASLAGGAVGSVRTPADQYASLLQSETIGNRIIDRFKLIEVYDAEFRIDARKALAENMRVGVGKKDNLITVEVDDHSSQRAAEMANAFVAELQVLSNRLSLTEAQQRRTFFEKQMKDTHAQLIEAQAALQKTGFNPGALKSEPKSTAESYARLKAQVVATEVRLRSMRSTLADSAPEIQSQMNALAELRAQLVAMEEPAATKSGDQDYISRYRQFKYQEALLEIMTRQYEVAKLDEAREGTQLQVVDTATVPERRSKPKRTLMTIEAALFGMIISAGWVLLRDRRRPL